LVLELINRGASAGAFHDTLEHYVTKEIFSKLTAEQKRVLTVLSIFRESVTLEALLAHELDVDVLDSLVEQGLARQVDTDVYDVHDLIREFLLQSLDEPTKKEVHNSCAAYYAKQAKSSEATLEQIYHELASDHQQEAISKIVEFGRDIVSQGHLELLNLIEDVNTDGLKPKTLAPMLQLQGDILLMLGRFEQASAIFEHASAASQSAGSEVLFSEILGSQADIAMKQGKTDSALESHKQALEVQVKLGDSKGAARSYNNMGYLYRRKNDKSKALAAYSEVEAILSNDQSLLGAQIILGRALLDLGEVDRARKHAFEAFERTDEGDDLLLHARAQALLGRYHAKMNDSETSLHHYSESLNVMSDAGDPVSLVEITILLGEVLEDSGRSEDALERYREALIIAEANDLRMQIGELLSKLGGVAPDRQRRMEYLQRALAVFRELGARTRMREVQAQVHAAVMGR
jgi:tetratricopeptide (TPR) repeat protein